MHSDLTRLDSRALGGTFPLVQAFIILRNEWVRLPYVLDYHRGLGVERFFIIDNQSNDGSREYVLSQPDCYVYSAAGSYSASGYGIAWLNAVIAEHAAGQWCLNVDSDECLVYPYCEYINIKQLCQHLDRVRSTALLCFLLDMYAEGSIAQAEYTRGEPLLKAAPLFDIDYRFWAKRVTRNFPATDVIGGPRLRAFYPEYAGSGPLLSAFPKLVRAVSSRVGIKTKLATVPPKLVKVPLLRANATKWITAHSVQPTALANTTGALLHFKFLADFHQRVTNALREGQHFDSGSEYERYRQALIRYPSLSFRYAGSCRYVDSGQLEKLGLIRVGELAAI